MTEVYLLWEGDDEDRFVAAVYSSLEAALAAHDGHDPEWRHEGDVWTCAWRQEAIPPVPAPVTFETRHIRVVDGVATLPGGRTIKTDAQYVSYPVAPEGYVPDFGTPARYCAFYLQRVPVQR